MRKEKLYLYKLTRPVSTFKNFSLKGNSELLNSLHYFYINSNYNIAFYHKYNDIKVEQTIMLFSKYKEELMIFKKFINENYTLKELNEMFGDNITEKNYTYFYNNIFPKIRKSYITDNDIQEIEFDIDDTILYKKTSGRLGQLSNKKFIQNLTYTFNNIHKEFKGIKKDIKSLIKIYNINSIEELLAKKEEFKKRLKKRENYFSINNVKFSSNDKSNGIIFFKEIKDYDKYNINWKVTSYGLSNNIDKIFPIPVNFKINT